MMQRPAKKEQTPQEFAKEHWKEILAISGTLAGAVILLLIRYHRKRKAEEGTQLTDRELAVLEEDALTSTRQDTPLILDLMPDIRRHIPDVEKVTQALSQGLPEATEELNQLDEPSTKRGWFGRKKRGNPRDLMQSVGKVR